MTLRSNVRILVERKPISSTTPKLLPKRQKSPILIGAEVYKVIAPMIFSTVFCAANAIAKPPIPKPANKVEALKPRFSSQFKAAMLNIMIFITVPAGLSKYTAKGLS